MKKHQAEAYDDGEDGSDADDDGDEVRERASERARE